MFDVVRFKQHSKKTLFLTKTVFQPTIENVDIVDQIEDYAESLQSQDEGQQEQLPDIDPDESFINLLHQGWETIVCTCHLGTICSRPCGSWESQESRMR